MHSILFHPLSSSLHPTPISPGVTDVQPEPLRVKVDLVVALLQYTRHRLGILKLPQIDVRPALLDRVTDELSGTSLTLRADDVGLLLLSRFVDDEGGALGFLLRDLLGFDRGGEFRGEGKLLSSRPR